MRTSPASDDGLQQAEWYRNPHCPPNLAACEDRPAAFAWTERPTYDVWMALSRRPDFRGQVMAVNRVEQLLRKVTKALEAARVPYAVVGGNAVAAWVASVDEGAVRATRDVDILLRRENLAAASAALRPLGLMPVEVLGVSMFVNRRRPNPKTGVHVVFAQERIRAHYAHPAPDLTDSVRAETGFLVIDLPALVMMKLQSFRDIDRAHLRDLLSVGLIDSAVLRKLPPDLRSRLKQIQETPE
ncbi:MAG: hypothetical protein V2A79_10400 [Planctomycetota bacterium]